MLSLTPSCNDEKSHIGIFNKDELNAKETEGKSFSELRALAHDRGLNVDKLFGRQQPIFAQLYGFLDRDFVRKDVLVTVPEINIWKFAACS